MEAGTLAPPMARDSRWEDRQVANDRVVADADLRVAEAEARSEEDRREAKEQRRIRLETEFKLNDLIWSVEGVVAEAKGCLLGQELSLKLDALDLRTAEIKRAIRQGK